MNPSATRNTAALHQIAIVILFVLLMAATRSHHVAGLHNLPDASWAIFFLAGQYVRRGIVFALLAVLATAIDAIAIGWGGVSDYCVTPAYAMLLPTYAALWLGGRWVARRMAEGRAALPTLVVAVGVSATIAELCSSGGFYFLGGRYAEPTSHGIPAAPRQVLPVHARRDGPVRRGGDATACFRHPSRPDIRRARRATSTAMTRHCPALLVTAPASGQGKTTLVAALARRQRNLGRRVRVFKVGPDFLDPMVLERASGNPVYQLDLFMGGTAHCRRLLHEAAGAADLILVEGVMGLLDGESSSADLGCVLRPAGAGGDRRGSDG